MFIPTAFLIRPRQQGTTNNSIIHVGILKIKYLSTGLIVTWVHPLYEAMEFI